MKPRNPKPASAQTQSCPPWTTCGHPQELGPAHTRLKLIAVSHLYIPNNIILAGGFTPSEKYESQWGLLFPIYARIKVMFQSPPTRYEPSLTIINHYQLSYYPTIINHYQPLLTHEIPLNQQAVYIPFSKCKKSMLRGTLVSGNCPCPSRPPLDVARESPPVELRAVSPSLGCLKMSRNDTLWSIMYGKTIGKWWFSGSLMGF